MRMLPAIAMFLLPPTCWAGDYYVHPNGVDDPGGGTPAAPWQTITFALATVPAPLGGDAHTIHVAQGYYSAASGEAFPLVMRPRVSLVGSHAPGAQPLLDAGPTGVVVEFSAYEDIASGKKVSFGRDTRLAAMLFQAPELAVKVTATGNAVSCSPTLSDLTMLYPTLGIDVLGGAGPCAPLIERLDVQFAAFVGVSVTTDPGSGAAVEIERSSFTNCATGVEIHSFGPLPFGLAELFVRGCRFQGNSTGLRVSTGKGGAAARLTSCLFFGNATALSAEPGMWHVSADLERCTVYANSIGLGNNNLLGYDHRIRSSIVWGNTTADLQWNGVLPFDQQYDIAYSDIGAGFPLGPTNLTIGPGFVGALLPELAATSPLVDAGDPSSPAGGTDLDLDALLLDGNGDGIARADIGADEFNLLSLGGPPSVPAGASPQLLLAGPSGRPYVLGVSTAPDDLPLLPYGSLLLDPLALVVIGGGMLPATVLVAFPPTLPSGMWVGFQFVSLDPGLPGVGGLSNRHEVRME